jgi:hypothetical protein
MYALPGSGNVSLKLYDIAGRLVSTLASGYHAAGTYSLPITASGLEQKLAAGIYVIRLDSDGRRTTQKLVVE